MNTIEEIKDQLQDGLYDYELKTNLQLINSIIDFGCGHLQFHTADIERLIRENEFYKKTVEVLIKNK